MELIGTKSQTKLTCILTYLSAVVMRVAFKSCFCLENCQLIAWYYMVVDYGVDFVLHKYDSLLSIVRCRSQLDKSVISNLLALELLCNLLVTYAPQLRENTHNFYTLVSQSLLYPCATLVTTPLLQASCYVGWHSILQIEPTWSCWGFYVSHIQRLKCLKIALSQFGVIILVGEIDILSFPAWQRMMHAFLIKIRM